MSISAGVVSLALRIFFGQWLVSEFGPLRSGTGGAGGTDAVENLDASNDKFLQCANRTDHFLTREGHMQLTIQHPSDVER